MTVKLYVEGGDPKNHSLAAQCRRGFAEFLRRAGLEGRMPRIVACGGRSNAFRDFSNAHARVGSNEIALLLVDSEAEVQSPDAWAHVAQRAGDGWVRPQGATQDQLHLMIQAMEAWFHADRDALQRYFGKEFRPNALSRRNAPEEIPKVELFEGLAKATRSCEKGEYSKGRHSFPILESLDPERVRQQCPSAHRFLEVLERVCGG